MATLAPSFAGMPFQTAEEMQPLKVPLPSHFESSSYLACAPGMAWQDPGYVPQLNPNQWADAVKAVAPFLNVKGMKRALCILDFAVANVQQMKVMEQASMGAGMGLGVVANLQRAAACAMLEAQMQEQQLALWQELQQLPFQDGIFCPYGKGAPDGFSPPSAAPAPLATPPGLPAKPDRVPKTPGSLASSTPKSQAQSPQSADSAGNAANRRRAPQTLSTSLRLLENEDADCLLIVRRISKLGFKATRSLKKHFSTYGPVVKVLLAHSTARQYNDQQFHIKRRPSNLGFIQMATSEAAKLILAEGSSHEIEGVEISVQRFERHGDSVEDFGFEEGQGDSPETPQKLVLTAVGRFERGVSEASTATASTMESFTCSWPDEFGEGAM